jgi:hypothetical protein
MEFCMSGRTAKNPSEQSAEAWRLLVIVELNSEEPTVPGDGVDLSLEGPRRERLVVLHT